MSETTPRAPTPFNPFAMLFGFRGRLGRLKYWIGLACALGLAFLALGGLAAANAPTGGAAGLIILALPAIIAAIWIHTAITVKRVRDAGQPSGIQALFAAGPWLIGIASIELIEIIGAFVGVLLLAVFVMVGVLPPKAATT